MSRSKSRRSRALLAAGLVAVVMVTSGCGSESADSSGLPGSRGEPQVLATDAVDNMSSLVLPLDAYILSSADYLLLSEAQAALVDQCMARFGLNYQRAA